MSRLREYHRPSDLRTAVELLRQGAAPLLLGPRPPVRPLVDSEAVVDLSRLNLHYIRVDDKTLHIGALTPLQDLATSLLLRSQANGILCQAAHLAAHLGLRHIATFAGALTAAAGPQEVRLAADALDYGSTARVVIQGQERYELPLSGWQRPLPGELLIELKLPRLPSHAGGALERVARTPRDEAILAVAAVVEAEGGSVQRARVVVGACVSRPDAPYRSRGVDIDVRSGPATTNEQVLQRVLQAIEQEVEPASDFRASADYRRAMASVLARRAFERALRHAR